MRKFRLRRLGLADDPGHYQPSLHACLEAVLEQSDALMDDVLGGLHAAANPAALTRETIARLQPEQVKATFAQELRRAIFGGEPGRNTSQAQVRFDDFQFLDSAQLDANIELALTQQDVQRSVEDVLPTLNAMVSNLLGWASVQAHLNPLKPESFVHALRETFAQHVPDDAARASVMVLAGGKLGVVLRQLYREVSDWLRSQGIEPVHVPKPGAGGFGSSAAPAQSSVARTMLTLDKLRRLLSGELNTGTLAVGSGDFSHTVPASFEALQDMRLVEPMMKRLAERASQSVQAVPPKSPPADLLAQELQKSQSRKLGQQLGEEVVRMMLDKLMQDQRLLPPVRDTLKTMEPILIKLADRDARFFSERQHPARQFLERMTHRSLAFTHVESAGFTRFQKAFDNAVRVLAGGEGDAASFSRVLRKLEEGWSKDEAAQHLRAEEAARNLLHAEQRNLLAQRLAEQYTDRLTKLQLPERVLAFLRGPWAQVVAQAQLTSTDGSVDPHGFQSLVDDLVWSVQLKLARRNRARLVQMVPGMLVTMRQGLQLIGYPQERMGVFFDELISFHEQVFEGPKPTQPDDLPVLTSVFSPDDGNDQAVGDVPGEVWMAASEAADSGFLEDTAQSQVVPPDQAPSTPMPPQGQLPAQAVDNLTTGSWVDLALSGAWVRAQLTWASPHRTLFMFISGGGMAHSMSRRTLDRLMAQGLLQLVSDGRVMDNALDAVAQAALQNDLNQAPRPSGS
jgi:hypothetical protein